MSSIIYKKRVRYKYTLVEDYSITTEFSEPNNIKTPFIDLTMEGKLTIHKGYAWDGPSGPTIAGLLT